VPEEDNKSLTDEHVVWYRLNISRGSDLCVNRIKNFQSLQEKITRENILKKREKEVEEGEDLQFPCQRGKKQPAPLSHALFLFVCLT